MGLKGKGSPVKFFLPCIFRSVFIFRLHIFHYRFTVDLNGDFPILHDDMLRVPFVIFDIHLFDICKGINAPGFSPVAMALVDLDFIAFIRPSFFLEFGMDENP